MPENSQKSLATLEAEGKEEKYITLETGSKISGYTREYLERLCRLNKVKYRVWNNGQLVIELESLLRETHAILLSYEGITFVDKSELNDPTPQHVAAVLSSALAGLSDGGAQHTAAEALKKGIAQEIPKFSDVAGSGLTTDDKKIEVVGRAVISDVTHPEQNEEKDIRVPMAGFAVELPPAPKAPTKPTETEISPAEAIRIASEQKTKTPAAVVPPPPAAERPSVTLTPTATQMPSPAALPVPHASTKAEHRTVRLSVSKQLDEWDTLIFEKRDAPTEIPAKDTRVPTELHPVITSADVREHHEDAPLFPPLGSVPKDVPEQKREVVLQKLSTLPQNSESEVVNYLPPEPAPDKKEAARKTILFTSEMAKAAETGVPSTLRESALVAAMKIAKTPTTTGANSSEVKSVDRSATIATTPVSPLAAVPLPKDLPMRAEERHPMIVEQHSLMKSPSFNAVVGLFLVGTSALLLTSLAPLDTGYVSNNSAAKTNVAAVGSLSNNPEMTPETTVLDPSLLFSDEVITAKGDNGELLVQPVLKDGFGPAVSVAP